MLNNPINCEQDKFRMKGMERGNNLDAIDVSISKLISLFSR
jgi:hypothetical protein